MHPNQHEWSLVYFSVTSNEIPNFSQAIGRYRQKIGPLKVTARTRTQLEAQRELQEQFITKALAADVVVITLMAGSTSCPLWERLIEQLELARHEGKAVPYLHIQPTGSSPEVLQLAEKYADSHAQGQWSVLHRYHRFGGGDNLLNFLITLANARLGTSIPAPPPCQLPFDGIYHPHFDQLPDLDTYLQSLDASKPCVGIWFYQNFWATGNCAHIDALIDEVERQGANVLCVFHMRFKDRFLNNNGPAEIIEKYFLDRGIPRISVLVSPVMFSLHMTNDASHLLWQLGVPVLQAMTTGQERKAWQESPQGLTNTDITIGVAQPELDGVLIGKPVAAKQTTSIDPITGSAINTYLPIGERITSLIRLALNWARLSNLANADKRVAIIFHHYPPRNDRIGCASGLDSFASVVKLVDQLIEQGYQIEHPYRSGDQLAQSLLSRLTADRRWLLPEQMAERSEASIDCATAQDWYQQLPSPAREQQRKDWGPFPGDLLVHDQRLFFPGMRNGNIFLTIQPPRGYFENIDQLYHNQILSPPYPYTAQYRWIKEVFAADAVLHIGKHGSLEWLPGKAVGLDAGCWPDIALQELPNIYPYIINDPGEGTQAKRRANACIIDHLPPALTNAELDEELAGLSRLLEQYREARVQDQGKLPLLAQLIWQEAMDNEIAQDLDIQPPQCDKEYEAVVQRLHDYLEEIGDTTITDGLHVLGQPPQGKLLIETLAQLTRLDNGDVPSLRLAVLDAQKKRSGTSASLSSGCTQSPGTKAELHQCCLDLLEEFLKRPTQIEALCRSYFQQEWSQVAVALSAIRDVLLPKLAETTQELAACVDALNGRFVLPGPSGAPSRGQIDILPTGRNFFSLDPQQIPTPAAWRVGQRLADALLARYLEQKGRYPTSVGLVLWASPTMRSKGDDVAQIFALMGLRPIWKKGSGAVRGLEVTPLSELGRPRIDVMPRISGIFRDAFPLLIDLIDQGVAMVAALEEDPESNYLRKHVLRDQQHWLAKGMSGKEALRQATFRLFSAPPGSYGTGVAELVESKNWNDADELGHMYIRWSSYAYGRDVFGQETQEGFQRVLSRMEVTVKNEDSREKDMMSCTDFYSHHGGLIAAVRSVRKSAPFSLSGDSADPEHVLMRTTQEEARHIFRSRLLNSKWLEGLQRHGFKGAGDISKAMDIILGWDATANVVDDWMYRRFARKVPLDPQMQQWMLTVNPHALHNIVSKLLEAAARSLWQADQETLDELQEIYLEVEGELEEASE